MPSSVNFSAMARPMPCPPPVTTATLPTTSFTMPTSVLPDEREIAYQTRWCRRRPTTVLASSAVEPVPVHGGLRRRAVGRLEVAADGVGDGEQPRLGVTV